MRTTNEGRSVVTTPALEINVWQSLCSCVRGMGRHRTHYVWYREINYGGGPKLWYSRKSTCWEIKVEGKSKNDFAGLPQRIKQRVLLPRMVCVMKMVECCCPWLVYAGSARLNFLVLARSAILKLAQPSTIAQLLHSPPSDYASQYGNLPVGCCQTLPRCRFTTLRVGHTPHSSSATCPLLYLSIGW